MNIIGQNGIKNLTANGQNSAVKTGENRQSDKPKINNESVQSLSNPLLKDINLKSKNSLLRVLKENGALNLIKETSRELKTIFELLQKSSLDKSSSKLLENLPLHVEQLDGDKIKEQIKNSGLFLESKLAKIVKNGINSESNLVQKILSNDIKASLLSLKHSLSQDNSQNSKVILQKVENVLSQINYYQLISYATNSIFIYLPLFFKDMQEGQLKIKRLKQKRYFCEINLKLKEFGEIELFIMLFDDVNINISFFALNGIFLEKVKQNLTLLKKGIKSVGLKISNIYMYDTLKDKKSKKEMQKYVQNMQIGQGINIHV